MATISRSVSRSATFAEPRYSTAQREGSWTGRPNALERLGQDNPIFSTAFAKCSAVSRAVPSALSCSCGCGRISSETRFSIGVMLSQMHSGNGLWQRGQSGIAAAVPVSGSDCFDIRPLYAAQRRASTTQGRSRLISAGVSIPPHQEVAHHPAETWLAITRLLADRLDRLDAADR